MLEKLICVLHRLKLLINSQRLFYPCTLVSSSKKKWPPCYSRNIVESGVKHHNPDPLTPIWTTQDH